MRTRTRQRALRILLSALLDSDLSSTDLREIAENIKYSDFTSEFSYLLEMMTDHFRRYDEIKKLNVASNGNSDDAFELAQRRKITKTSILKMMEQASDGQSKNFIDKGMTMRQIFEMYFSNSSEADVERFLSLIDGSGSSDPYLSGIINRQRS